MTAIQLSFVKVWNGSAWELVDSGGIGAQIWDGSAWQNSANQGS